MKPKQINNSLIDVSYFIKNKVIQNDVDSYLYQSYKVISSPANQNRVSSFIEHFNEENYKNEQTKYKINSIIGTYMKSPLPKISFQANQKTYNNTNYFDNFNLKKKCFANSITNTPSRDNKKYLYLSNKFNYKSGKKDFIVDVKVNFPFLNVNNNNNNDKIRSSININHDNNINDEEDLNSCLTISKEKNRANKLINILHKKHIDSDSSNFRNIIVKLNENGNNKIQEVNYLNKYKNGKIFINNIINHDKYRYKNRKLFQQKFFKLNNIFSFNKNSQKDLNNNNEKKDKDKEIANANNNDSYEIKNNNNKIILNLKNLDKKLNATREKNAKNEKKEISEKNKNIENNKKSEKNDNKLIKKIMANNNESKKLKIENKENSFTYENRNNLKLIKNGRNKPNNLMQMLSQKKLKVRPKLSLMTKLDKFPTSYNSKEYIIRKYLSKKECPYNLNNNSNVNIIIDIEKNINLPIEKYYYTINKMYRNQLPEYMKHRINWEYIDSKKINLQEQKNININFEWRYLSSRLNFKKYKYEPGSSAQNRRYKMVNLFEKNYEIGNKRNMFINLISYCDEINFNVFEIVPFTVTINYSKDIDQFLDALKEIINFINSKKNNKNDQNLIINRKYGDQFWFDKNYEYLENQYIYINKNFLSNKNYWIIKPPDLYQGICIEISNNFDEIKQKCKNMFKGVDKRLAPDLEVTLEEEDSDEDKNNINSNINNSLINEKNYLNINLNNSGSDFELRSDEKILNNSIENINNNTSKYKKKEQKKVYSRITCFNEIIIQKYLDNPLLYKKRKFDIRCFALVDSNLNVFFCREGHLKGSSELYDINNTNKFIHITNHSLQKKSSKFEYYEYGNEMSYSDFKEFMKEEKIPLENFNKMIERMKFLVKISFKAVGSKLLRITPVLCFEIFGYDFILDNDFNPWILEINNNPGLGISSPVIQKLVPRMIDDALRLTIDKVFETKYDNECIDENGKYKSKYKLEGFTDEENIFEFLCNVG